MENIEETIKKTDTQSRDWVFTVNNPTITDDEFFEYLKSLVNIRYFIFCREKGAGTEENPDGTIHFQGYMEFSMPKKFSTVCGYLSAEHVGKQGHVESRIKSRKVCVDYVKKIGKHSDKANTHIGEVYEFGDFAIQGKRNDIIEVRAAIMDNNMSPSEVILNTDYVNGSNLAYMDRLYYEKMKAKYSIEDRPDLNVIYVYGVAGKGKTSTIYKPEFRKDMYRVTNYSHPFDNYAYQKTLILDEFNSQFDATYFNNLIDIYPCELDCRYSPKYAAWETIYIISNIPLDRIYPYLKGDLRKPLNRRIKYYWRFGTDKEPQPWLGGERKSQEELRPLTQEELQFMNGIFDM